MELLFQFLFNILVGLVAGIIAGIIAIWYWEIKNKPKLSIEIKEKSQDNDEPAIYDGFFKTICEGDTNVPPPSGKPFAIYHLDVKNKGKTAAIDCEAYFTFYSENKKLFDTIKAKWDAKPEPVFYQWENESPSPPQQTGKKLITGIDPNKIYYSEIVNINPDSHQSFAIILKYDGEENCYPFSVWSYYCKGFRVKEKIPKGVFTLEVQVKHARKESVEASFKIKNLSENMRSVVIEKIN